MAKKKKKQAPFVLNWWAVQTKDSVTPVSFTVARTARGARRRYLANHPGCTWGVLSRTTKARVVPVRLSPRSLTVDDKVELALLSKEVFT